MNSEIADSFISHLIELRTRFLHAAAAILLVFICLFPFSPEIYALLAHPMLVSLPAGGEMIATDVTTPFLVPMKVTMMAAFLIALPYVLYQAWAFVAPGLYDHEKSLAVPLITASTFLFFCGMAFAYFLILPATFHFLVSWAPEGVKVMTDIDKYLSFVLTLFMAFGITFEVPVAVILLVKMNMVSVKTLKEIRPYVVVGAFIIGAIFTPPDIFSQIMLAVPLWLLYELGIIIASIITRPPATKTVHALSEEELKQELREFEALESEVTKKDS